VIERESSFRHPQAQAFRAGVGESWLRPDLSSPETMPLTP